LSGTLQPGALLGRYRIVRLLGSGAMGDVYLAEDPQIERQLAIKTVRVAEGKPEDVEDRKRRLLREAKAAGRMIHPHVVTLFDAGEAEGVLYLAFEFVGGSDLSQRMESDPPLTLGEVLRIVRESADALDFAHRQGIVHRDIKPANIMLDTHGRVKVADFGIAKVVGQATELTMTGSVVGSPHYLSPEQVRGEELDGRTDVFSLGVVLYELLGHRRPFQGESLTTLVYQILHQEPPPIPQLRPELAPYLDSLVRRMMAKDREQRFANAGAVAAEIATLERDLGPERLAQPVEAPDMESGGTRLMAASGPSAMPGSPSSPSISTSPTAFAPPPTGVATAPGLRPPTGAAPIATAAAMPLASAVPPPAKRSPLPWILAVLAVVLIGGGFGAYLLLGKLLFKPKPPQIGKEPVAVSTVQPEAPRPEPKPAQPEAPPEPVKPEPKAVVVPPAPPKPAPVTPEPANQEPAPKPHAASPEAPVHPTPPRPAPPQPEPVAPEPEPEPVAAPSFDHEISTGLAIAFNIIPDTARVRFKALDERRWTVLGQAKEWSGKKDARVWQVPDAGDYLVGVVTETREVTYLVHAQPGGPNVPITLNLGPPKKR
jgi:serine/threonine protein kinase